MKFKQFTTLCLLIALSISQVIFAEDYYAKLGTASEWALNEITLAIEQGVVSDKLFAGNMQAPATREGFAEIAVTVFDKIAMVAGTEINQDSADAFYDTKNLKVIRAYMNGIVTGVGDNKFNPDGNLTREQLCTMLYRVVKKTSLPGFSVNQPPFEFQKAYSDIDEISPWALEAVSYMNQERILRGDGDKLHPKAKVSRQEAIVLAYRTYRTTLSCHVAIGAKDSLSLENFGIYKNMAKTRAYCEVVPFDNSSFKAWEAVYTFVNIEPEYDYTKIDRTYSISHNEAQNIYKNLFNATDEELTVLEGIPVEISEDIHTFFLDGTLYLYLTERYYKLHDVEIVKTLRDEHYKAVGYRVSVGEEDWAKKTYDVYFAVNDNFSSGDRFYYHIDRIEKQ